MVLAGWKEELNDKKSILAVFVDLKRAFETIDRSILIQKLFAIGVKDVELRWFKSFLEERMQQTVIGSSLSEKIEVKIGLPQGSVLAPILFNLYINDVVASLKFSSIKLFADDALIMISGVDVNDMRDKLNSDLESFYNWLCVNRLKLNIDKTKYMFITRNNSLNVVNIKINSTVIEKVCIFKYLGIQIDDKLKFFERINYTVSKIAKKIYFMKRTCKYLRKYYKIMVYRSIIEPHFIYCPTIFFIMNDSQIEKLQKMQNKAMRFILKKRYDTPIKEMLVNLNWLSVKQQIFYFTMKFINNIKTGNLPTYLSDQLKLIHETHNINTRTKNNFKLPLFRTEADKNSLFYKGLKSYNELPEQLKHCVKNLFKSKLYEYSKTLPIR